MAKDVKGNEIKVGDRVRVTGRPCFLGSHVNVGDTVILRDYLGKYHGTDNGYNKNGIAWRAIKDDLVFHIFDDDIEKLPDDKPSEGASYSIASSDIYGGSYIGTPIFKAEKPKTLSEIRDEVAFSLGMDFGDKEAEAKGESKSLAVKSLYF